MAIAKLKPSNRPNIALNLPKVEPNVYKGIINDDKDIPLRSLIAYTEGSPWTVNYYSQVLGEHNDLREIDLAQAAVYQQYQKIINLEIRVNSPLDTSYDSTTGITSSKGNAVIYGFITPNISDYFTASVGDGQLAIFRITDVDRKTFNRDSVFSIEYELTGYVKDLQAIFDDLENKSIRKYYFSKDRLVDGLQPVLKEEDYQQISSLQSLYSDICHQYFKTFYNKKFGTLILPGQDSIVYDHYVVDYVLKLVDTNDAEEIQFIRQLPKDDEKFIEQSQFWDLMLRKDYDGLDLCNKTMGLVNKLLFNSIPDLRNMKFLNIDYVVYPEHPDMSLYQFNDPGYKHLADLDLESVPNVKNTLADLVKGTILEGNVTYTLAPLVTVDNYYVLSEALYSDLPNKSIIEILVTDYLKNNALNLSRLLALCSKYRTWGRLEQYYYGPILLTLIKEADRGTYS